MSVSRQISVVQNGGTCATGYIRLRETAGGESVRPKVFIPTSGAEG